jgi:prepilin-type N-terminal cleavage/methylation domain-containing protein
MTIPVRFRSSGRRGFTLAEVLVVVAILLTLAAVAMVALRHAVAKGKGIHSAANLRNLAVANASYLAENGVYCPAGDRTTNRRWHGTRTSASGKFNPKKGFLSPYLGESEQVGVCPLFKPTSNESFEDGTGGYGYNAAYIGGLPGMPLDPKTGIYLSQRAVNVQNPSRTIMFTTAAYAQPGGLQEYAFCEPPFRDDGDGPSGWRLSPTVHFRVNGKALVAWCDGSVSSETRNSSSPGYNPHGGDATKEGLGWVGPEENNGWWNPQNWK